MNTPCSDGTCSVEGETAALADDLCWTDDEKYEALYNYLRDLGHSHLHLFFAQMLDYWNMVYKEEE